MAAPLRPSQPPDGCNTHAAKRARTSPGVDAPPGQETLDATWVLYNQDEASVWPELQEGPFMGSRLVSPDDQCIYGMVSTEISRMPFAVVACTRTPWPLNGPVGYRLHQRGAGPFVSAPRTVWLKSHFRSCRNRRGANTVLWILSTAAHHSFCTLC